MRAMQFLMATTALALLFASAAQADLAISSRATQNVSCVSGVCTATAQNAVLNAADLATMLASGDVTVKTGGGATNIVVKAGFGWTNTSRLTLDANRSVSINKPVSVTGSGAMTIKTNDGGSGGDLMFDGKGNVKFWDTGSSLVINGDSYTLVNDIATLASDIAAKPSGFYALANDYDASADGTYTSAPITTELTGTFEGLGHAVANLSINSSDAWIGLFANANGTLRDVGVLKVSITGNGLIAGGLLGESHITNIVGCYATGSIAMDSASVVGGLVGQSNDEFSDGQIVRSHADVEIQSPVAAASGGLVGESSFAVSQSYATGRVSVGDHSSAGGLIGSAGGSVSESYATGQVKGGDGSSLGGLVGTLGASSEIDNSYSTGAIHGGKSAFVAGFVGDAEGNILSSYAIGNVAGGKSGISSGFLGALGEGVQYALDYWDIDTTGKGKRAGCGGSKCHRHGATGLTTAEFQSGLPAEFDPTIWGEKASINGGFPYLLANPPQ